MNRPLTPRFRIRPAEHADTESVLALAQAFTVSFPVEPVAFRSTFTELLTRPDTRLLVAVPQDPLDVAPLGYLLGFLHPTFYANGPVAWVEEIAVHESHRRSGIGAALMHEFEAWAVDHQARLVALATRRAAPFYRALGYEESATYFRKLLPS